MISAEAFLRSHPVASQTVPQSRDASASACGVEADASGDGMGPAGIMGSDGTPDVGASGLSGSSRIRRTETSLGASHTCRWGRSAAAQDPDDVDACREAALRLLDAAARSSGSLRARLLDKGYGERTVDQVIDRLGELHLIDDEAYAESVMRICAGRMMGRRGAVMELARRGVDRALANRVADEADGRGVFEEAAWELGRQVARRTQGLDTQVRMRRFWSAGGRKGHDPETLRMVARELLG